MAMPTLEYVNISSLAIFLDLVEFLNDRSFLFLNLTSFIMTLENRCFLALFLTHRCLLHLILSVAAVTRFLWLGPLKLQHELLLLFHEYWVTQHLIQALVLFECLNLKNFVLILRHDETIHVLILSLAVFDNRRDLFIEQKGRHALWRYAKVYNFGPVHEVLDFSIVVKLPHRCHFSSGISLRDENQVMRTDKARKTYQVIGGHTIFINLTWQIIEILQS
jgi:hypothetical protein